MPDPPLSVAPPLSPLGSAGDPLPSRPVPGPPPPWETAASLRFTVDLGSPFLTGFVACDPVGAPVLRGRRDGTGLAALRMNFALEDPSGGVCFLIREPEGRIALNAPFRLVAPDGTAIGELRTRLGSAVLAVPDRPPFEAELSALAWKGYPVVRGGRSLATVSYRGHPFTVAGAEQLLDWEPMASAEDRWGAVALVSFLTLIHAPWRRMTTR